MNTIDNQKFMQMALEEAKVAAINDEVPIGCVIVCNGEVIAKSHNEKVEQHDATKHAEILAINRASEFLNSWYLNECDMYVTLEPCMMCTGAIINSRIRKVFYATEDPKGGCFTSNIKILDVAGINHYPEFECGLLKAESALLLKEFFKKKRELAKINKNK